MELGGVLENISNSRRISTYDPFKKGLCTTYLMWRGLLCDHGIDEVIEIRGETLECQVRVLSQHICCQVIVVVLDVQQEKVGKRLC